MEWTFWQIHSDFTIQEIGICIRCISIWTYCYCFLDSNSIRLAIHDIKGVPFFCYTAATAVGMSRLTEHEHWASDVFVGALLGYLSGKQVVRHFNKLHQNTLTDTHLESKTKTELTFFQDENQIGLLVKW